ncbi:DUF5698 domain-containing protein [Alkaliphilus sp. B6464]|uniref:DUF5698 domain-containing protein n=1 Tax=Alkaliphilus sp. B6464 TaxID=2731219 RepID=UPI001BA914EC|nr:DUF5698 domain-containing protein [Alkaliphilus sp. B6464]QUH21895.1 DUF2179 domain-containing protein [Alkaliphilus sp. B6464]
MVLNLMLVFILNILSNTIGTMKTIFISKNLNKEVYIITFIDAIMFMSIFKSISQENSFLFIIAFALGKTIGSMLGNYIESKLALGILGVTVYAKQGKAVLIADTLRGLGYSVTNFEGYGMNGSKRYAINIVIARKEFKLLKEILEKYDYTEANMIISEIKKTTGKINTLAHNL